MTYPGCHVIYLDRRATASRYEASTGKGQTAITYGPDHLRLFSEETREVHLNLDAILSVFNGVHICITAEDCVAKIRELDTSIRTDCKPTLVLLHIPEPNLEHHRRQQGHSSPSSNMLSSGHELSVSSSSEDHDSMQLLLHIANEIASTNYSKLIVPVAIIQRIDAIVIAKPSRANKTSAVSAAGLRRPSNDSSEVPNAQSDRQHDLSSPPVDPKRMLKYLEAGAVDVLNSPLTKDGVYGLVVHVHRAHKESVKDQAAFLATMRLRKRSWVGIDKEVPYAYLREAMVSHLMMSICKPEMILQTHDLRHLYVISPDQETLIAKAISSWNFSAHDFSEDELVHAAFLMLQHALQLPSLEKWRLPADDLKNFVMACRAAYNGFVLYHNFRHVVDVLQAIFYFLLQLGTIPPHPACLTVSHTPTPNSPIAALLKPFDALTLLISAIGHDVGHPGVNNAFLVALKAPLAQLYNDNSVLEAFHCAAYSQILRRYWPVAFEDIELRKLLIKSILATDMGVHFKYMADLGNLQDKVHHNKGTDGWSPQILEEYKTLVCGLLIKCADISNVARPFDIAKKWSDILQLEFAKQGEMEKDVGIPTTLPGGPPELGNVTKLANSQIGFMNIFAYPLFDAVTDILPGMKFATEVMKRNQAVWKAKIEEEKSKERFQFDGARYTSDGFQSPRSGSPDRMFAMSPVASHPEGLPASGSTPSLPAEQPMSTSQSVPNFQHTYPDSTSIPGLGETSTLGKPPQDLTRLPSPAVGTTGQSMSTQEAMPSSRRSSGAYPGANILSPDMSTRTRPSNTVPSQLQLGLGSAPGDQAPAVSENAQPRRPSADSMPTSNGIGNGGVIAGPRLYGSTSTGASVGRANGSRRGDKGSDEEPNVTSAVRPGGQKSSSSHSGRHSAQQSSGRYSAFSSQDRFSNATSGAHTVASHAPLSSPTETQATSFLTEGSDVGTNDDGAFSTSDIADMELPASTHKYTMGGNPSWNEIKTPVHGMNGHALGSPELVVRKKSSRFRFDFWKKKSKEGSSSSPGSP